MEKTRIALFMLCLLMMLSGKVMSCDPCSTGTSNMGIGLLKNNQSNFLRLGILNKRFTDRSLAEFSAFDYYTRINISFSYNLPKRRLRFEGHLPFAFNSRSTPEGMLQEQGVADARLIANYTLASQSFFDDKAKIYLEIGGGVSLPSGRRKDMAPIGLPEQFSLGTGGLGYILKTNASLKNGVYGVLFNSHYQLNSSTSNSYRFGDQLTYQLIGFKEYNYKRFTLIPNLGLMIDQISKDFTDDQKVVTDSGGEGIFISTAYNLRTDRWLAGISYAYPLVQRYSDGIYQAQERLALHFTYIIH